MTKQAFIEMIENMPDNAELVVSNYTIGFVVTDVENMTNSGIRLD